jgi:HAD superfamily hydrolase (TIGR01549 family)
MDTIHTRSPWSAAPIKVVLFDLWKTIARGPYPEPIANFRTMLGLDGKVDDDQFLRVCLTTCHEEPLQYMLAIAEHFGVTEIPANALPEFEALVRREQNGLLQYTDVPECVYKLKQAGYQLGLVTNSWPFPVRKFLRETRLDELFTHVISSSEVGLAKQDGPEIYFLAAQRFGVAPEQCVMVGDNPALDIVPALATRAKAVLIDRDETYVDGEGKFKKPEHSGLSVPVIRKLDDLLKVLG